MVKYIYSDLSKTAVKSEQADLVVSAVERFAQQIPLNLQEIFIWYFEQKGVDNPERFLAEVNEVNEQTVPSPQPSPVWRGSAGQAVPDNNPENPIITKNN